MGEEEAAEAGEEEAAEVGCQFLSQIRVFMLNSEYSDLLQALGRGRRGGGGRGCRGGRRQSTVRRRGYVGGGLF